jgi:O-acetyl-ADP-ribose deacetylase (regulator of RNase III)
MEVYNIQNKVKLVLKKGDITKEEVDIIANAANSRLIGGGGVDGAIHRAGGPSIMEELSYIRDKIGGYLPTGKAVITRAGNLKAKYVIHAVGPIWKGGNYNEPELLGSAYVESLKLADEKNAKSIAFPSISTGVYGYPVKLASKVALSSVINYIKQHNGKTSIQEIRFVLFDDKTYNAYKESANELLGDKS